jgi:hypothetical protein
LTLKHNGPGINVSRKCAKPPNCNCRGQPVKAERRSRFGRLRVSDCQMPETRLSPRRNVKVAEWVVWVWGGLCQVAAVAWLSGSLTPFAAAARPQFVKPRGGCRSVGRVVRRPLLRVAPLRSALYGCMYFVPFVCLSSRCCRQLVDRGSVRSMRRALSSVSIWSVGTWSVGGLLRTLDWQARCFGAVANGLTGEENQKFQAGDFPTKSREFNGRQTGMLGNLANEGVLLAGKCQAQRGVSAPDLGRRVTSDG